MKTKTRRYKRTTDEYLQGLVHDYAEMFGVDEVDLDDVARHVIEQGLYDKKPDSMHARCKRELGRALAREMYIDPQRRAVRRNHAFKVKYDDGQMKWEWAPIDKIKPNHMRASLTHRRDGMVALAIQHKTDLESYNDNNPYGAQLELFDYNINIDLAENELPSEYPDDDPDAPINYQFPSA